ncbi:MAG: LacI family transcriptional regulator [Solirubrobacteraceae bacterium]|nr:LacI family transcriptional regulator [Solirubrobacteraceae bacterium]
MIGADGAPARRPTMREVAAVADVSLSTVSRVVNGIEVGPELARRVREAVALLGYRRDLTATTLRRADRLSATIGLLLEDVANPFFSALHRSVEDVAGRRGVLAFAGSSDEDPVRERELVHDLLARGVDGLIIAPTGADQSYLSRDRRAGVAVVFVDRPARFMDADAVVSDNAGGADAAVSHLIAGGHGSIAFLGDRPEIHTAAERLRGYREALARHGIGEDPTLVRRSLLSPGDAFEATRDLLSAPNPPTALFTSQNLITIGAVRALHDLGLQHAVALAGFDDIPLADVVEPALTVVAQEPAALGRAAADLLFARLDGDDGPSRRVVLPTTLVPRGSGELPPASID